MRIGIDGMGGDNAPKVIVEGAIQAARQYEHDIVIVGVEDTLKRELSRQKNIPSNIHIHHASEIVEMGESAVASVRRKKDSSISVLTDLAREKKIDAMVSAGNTGAVVAAATLKLGLLEGVERPGIAIVFKGLEGISMIIDVGANIDTKPMHLFQYAIMCEAYSRYILGKDRPKVALLNVGEEASKGTEDIKETRRLLDSSRINFIGNIEGGEIYKGKCDVIVCDGFIGNAVLKVSEGIAESMVTLLKKEIKKSILRQIGGLFCLPVFKALKKDLDYSEYGGAPLLGVDGICIIGHGRSNAKAIKNAIRVAGEYVKHQVNRHIVEALRQF